MTYDEPDNNRRELLGYAFPNAALRAAAREITRIVAEYELDDALDHRVGEVAVRVFDDEKAYGLAMIVTHFPALTGYSVGRLRAAAAMYRAVPDRAEFRALLARRDRRSARLTLDRQLLAAGVQSGDNWRPVVELVLGGRLSDGELLEVAGAIAGRQFAGDPLYDHREFDILYTFGAYELADEIDKYVSRLVGGQCALPDPGTDGVGQGAIASEERVALEWLARRVVSAARRVGAQEAALWASAAPQD